MSKGYLLDSPYARQSIGMLFAKFPLSLNFVNILALFYYATFIDIVFIRYMRSLIPYVLAPQAVRIHRAHWYLATLATLRQYAIRGHGAGNSKNSSTVEKRGSTYRTIQTFTMLGMHRKRGV